MLLMRCLKFSSRILLRESRSGELTLLALALVIAIMSLTSMGFLTDRVARGLSREANQLMGGDLLLKSNHPWQDEVPAQALQQNLRIAQTILFSSMISTEDRAELAGVKAVSANYPLRGFIRIVSGSADTETQTDAMPDAGRIWLDERLMTQLGVQVGDQVSLGMQSMTVSAMITFESDRGANFFSLLPRAIFNMDDLPATQLLVEGSRATWRLHFAGDPQAVERFTAWVTPRLQHGQAVETMENARPEISRALDSAGRFLRLMALLAVIFAAVAIGLTSRRFMQRHLGDYALMRCLGASRRYVLSVYLGAFLLFTVCCALLGCLAGWCVQFMLAHALSEISQVSLPAASLAPAGQGILAAVVLMLGFMAPQVIRLGAVPVLAVLRRELVTLDSHSALVWSGALLSLLALIFWVAGQWRLALAVAGGFAVAVAIFSLTARLILKAAGKVRRRGGIRSGWGYGLALLQRHLLNSVIQITAMGIGIMALLLLWILKDSLLGQWQYMTSREIPNHFIINIQPQQREALARFFTAHGLDMPQIDPMIRGRLSAINDEVVQTGQFQDERTRRLAEREFNLGYSARLPDGNTVVSGQWHGSVGQGQFSVEKDIAERLGLKVGDNVRFTVAGQEVEAPVTSVRQLDWNSMRVNFFFLASPGLLDHFPASMVTSFHLPERERSSFTADLVRQFPNMTVINIRTVLEQIRFITDRLIMMVQVLSIFALLSGLIVMFAALQSTHDARAFEIAVLRVLGGRNDQLRRALLCEFFFLGLIAGVLGTAVALALGWGLSVWVFGLAFVFPYLLLPVALAAGVAGIMLAGWFGSRSLLMTPPLRTLRPDIMG